MPCAPTAVSEGGTFRAVLYAVSKARAGERPPCRHCKARPARKWRGLCTRCYYVMEVRALYPPDARTGPKGPPVNFKGGRRPPARPTDAAPGSEEKIRVLAERVAARTSLWHPLDRSSLGHRDKRLTLLGEDD